jgi:hypothetical protein
LTYECAGNDRTPDGSGIHRKQSVALINVLDAVKDELVTKEYFDTQLGAFRAEMQAFRAEMRVELQTLRADLKADIVSLQFWLVGGMATSVLALIGLVITLILKKP